MSCQHVDDATRYCFGSHILCRISEKVTWKTTIIVMILCYPFDEGRFGSMSTSKQSSGPNVNSVLLNILGRICLISDTVWTSRYPSSDFSCQSREVILCSAFLHLLRYSWVFIRLSLQSQQFRAMFFAINTWWWVTVPSSPYYFRMSIPSFIIMA